MSVPLPLLPLGFEIETRSMLKKLVRAHRALAELKGMAAKYLDELVRVGMLEKHRISKENFYLNVRLYELLLNASELTGGEGDES
jgi:hypothetical protein